MKTWICIALVAALGACASQRTTAPIARDTLAYSNAISHAQQQQLLLNIVRLRYQDPVSFVEVQTLTTEDTRTRGARLATAIGLDTGSFDEVLSGDAFQQNSESPTAVYNVLRGGAYAQQLLHPVAPESIFLLSQSGWSVERLMLCCVARMGDLENARAASGPTPEQLPDNRIFREFARRMRQLQVSGDLLVQVLNDAGEADARIVITWHAGSDEGDALAQMFESHRVAAHFSRGKRHYTAELATRSARRGDAPVRGRSLLGMLAALSQTVDVPPEHAALVTHTSSARTSSPRAPCSPGAPWDAVIGDYFAVNWSAAPPSSAAVSVPYRGYWFYIDDTCRSAKSTLDLIGHLYAIQAGLSDHGQRDTLLLIGR